MNDLSTFDQLAKEKEKEVRRRRIRWSLLAVLIVVFMLDQLIFGPRASRTQREIEQALNALPLPPSTAQVDFGSGHQTHHGYATRVLSSAKSPQEVCEFYKSRLSADAWRITHEDCQPALSGGLLWPDAGRGHILLEFRRGKDACRIKYYGTKAGSNEYMVSLVWGVF